MDRAQSQNWCGSSGDEGGQAMPSRGLVSPGRGLDKCTRTRAWRGSEETGRGLQDETARPGGT
jgi:hypothetical protein